MIAASNLKYVLQKIQCDIYYPVQEGFLFLVVFFLNVAILIIRLFLPNWRELYI